MDEGKPMALGEAGRARAVRPYPPRGAHLTPYLRHLTPFDGHVTIEHQ